MSCLLLWLFLYLYYLLVVYLRVIWVEIFLEVLGSDFFIDSIFVLPQNLVLVDAEFIPVWIKLIPSILSLSGIYFSFFIYKYLEKYIIMLRFKSKLFNSFYKFLVQKWYFDYLQNEYIGKFILQNSFKYIFKMIDKGFLEIIGPMGLLRVIFFISYNLKKYLQSGIVYFYTFFMFLFLIQILYFGFYFF